MAESGSKVMAIDNCIPQPRVRRQTINFLRLFSVWHISVTDSSFLMQKNILSCILRIRSQFIGLVSCIMKASHG